MFDTFLLWPDCSLTVMVVFTTLVAVLHDMMKHLDTLVRSYLAVPSPGLTLATLLFFSPAGAGAEAELDFFLCVGPGQNTVHYTV